MRYQEILETQEKHKANALKFASTHEDGGAYWADIPTRISGCERIFWVPLSRKYPYFLVEPTTGRVFSPSENCKVVEFNRKTGYHDIDVWIQKHRKLLIDAIDEVIEQTDLYESIESQNLEESNENQLTDVLKFASTHEDGGAYWADVQPRLSNISRVIWVPMTNKYPYILVEPNTGRVSVPSKNCTIVGFNSPTGYSDVDFWLNSNKKLLSDLKDEKIDQQDFYSSLREDLSKNSLNQ